MDLESFYIPVKIEGIALVYAKSREKAEEILKDSIPAVAGNKMCKNFELKQIGPTMNRSEFENV